VHCGDGCRDLDPERFDVQVACESVAGNCDSPAWGQPVCEFERVGVRFMVVHGHRFGIHFDDFQALVDEAHRRDVQVVLFGHTHRPLYRVDEGIHLFNPGTLQRGHERPSYGRIQVGPDGQLAFEHVELDGETGG
jgi:putative phosphoesterase